MKSSDVAPAPSLTTKVSSSDNAETKGEHASPGADGADGAVPADIRGPSAEDWDRYKRTIINMYGTMKLKDIRARMGKEHGFHATYVIPVASDCLVDESMRERICLLTFQQKTNVRQALPQMGRVQVREEGQADASQASQQWWWCSREITTTAKLGWQ